MTDSQTATPPTENELEGLYGLNDDVVRAVNAAIESGSTDEVAALAEPLHAADLADLFERLSYSDRSAFIQALGDRLDPEFVSHVDETVRDELVKMLDTEQIAQVSAE